MNSKLFRSILKNFFIVLGVFSTHSIAGPDIKTTHSWIKKHLQESSFNRVSGNWLPEGVVGLDVALKGDWQSFDRQDDQCSLVITSAMFFYKGKELINLENFPHERYPQYLYYLADYVNETHFVVRFPSELTFESVAPHTEQSDDSLAIYENYYLKVQSPTVRFMNVKNADDLINGKATKQIWEERLRRVNSFSIPLRSKRDSDRLKKALVNLNDQCSKIDNAF